MIFGKNIQARLSPCLGHCDLRTVWTMTKHLKDGSELEVSEARRGNCTVGQRRRNSDNQELGGSQLSALLGLLNSHGKAGHFIKPWVVR